MNRKLIPLIAFALALPALAGCLNMEDSQGPAPGPGDADTRELVIMTHDSYYIGQDVIDAFEAEHGVTVRQLPSGDAATTVNLAVLNKANPIADLLFGVDNTLIARAKAEGIFEPYEPENASRIRSEFVFDDEWHATPVDYGYVNVNYDKAALQEEGLEPPTSLEELTEPEWQGKLVVQNPATSSPGLAFLLATVAHFGTEGDYTYQDYWSDLKANDVRVAQGWSDAYFTHFSGGGYGGTYPLVVSYTSSPPYAVREACTVDGEYQGLDDCPKEDQVMPTANADLPGGAWLQVEAMGVLAGAENADLAKAFIEFALSREYQESASFHMFVYPVTEDATAPDFFTLVEEPSEPADLPAEEITDDNVDAWLDGWSEAVIG